MRRFVATTLVALIGLLSFLASIGAAQPVERRIRIEARSFAFEPAVVHIRQGERVLLEFVSLDVTHGIYFDGYKVDVVSEVGQTETAQFVADRPGKFRFRCSVACGVMHPFMIGEFIVEPNRLFPWSVVLSLIAGIGSLAFGRNRAGAAISPSRPNSVPGSDADALRLRARASALVASARARASIRGRIPTRSGTGRIGWRYELTRNRLVMRVLRWRGLQPALILPMLFGFVLVILAGLIGTPAGGSNFAIIFVWIVWFALLMILLVPFAGRLWCVVCPIPAPGEWLQRRRIVARGVGRPVSLGLKWPRLFDNIWLQNAMFLGVAIFSGLVLTLPWVTGVALVVAVLLALGLSLAYEGRIFCRYLCPVGGFIGLYSLVSPLELRIKDMAVCRAHRDKECWVGNDEGYGCPWLVRPWQLRRNPPCGLCTECLKTCSKDNIAVSLRPFGAGLMVGDERRLDEAYKALIMLTCAFVYSAVFLGPWAWMKDLAATTAPLERIYFGAAFLAINLLAVPGLFLLAAWLTKRLSRMRVPLRQAFVDYAYALVPLGLSAWIAFTISFVFVSGSYAISVISDPFGWGWNLFGTRGFPWTPVLMEVVPYLQVIALLVGQAFSIRTAAEISGDHSIVGAKSIRAIVPVALFISLTTIAFFRLYLG